MPVRHRASTLLLALCLAGMPALAQPACACEEGDTGVRVQDVDGAVARITQTSPALPTPPGREAVATGTPTTVTYHMDFLDRNGEADLEPNTSPQLLLVEILRPDGSPADEGDHIRVPAPNGCQVQPVVVAKGGALPSLAYLLASPEDRTPGNGIVSCDLAVEFNAGGDTPTGIYSMRASVAEGKDDPGAPIRTLSSQGVTTTVYQVLALSTQVGDGGIDFGAVKPGEIALKEGLRVTPGDDVVVANEGTSPTSMQVRMTATDLVADSGSAITCEALAVALVRQPTPADAFAKALPGSSCTEKVFSLPPLYPGQDVRFQAAFLDPGTPSDNYALAAGRYAGTLTVCLTGPSGETDPVSLGSAPDNPTPSWNYDLTEDVDEVGPVQSTE